MHVIDGLMNNYYVCWYFLFAVFINRYIFIDFNVLVARSSDSIGLPDPCNKIVRFYISSVLSTSYLVLVLSKPLIET